MLTYDKQNLRLSVSGLPKTAAAYVALVLMLLALSPINSVAAGSDFTFSPSSLTLTAVIGTETDTQEVELTKVSGRVITITSITQEFGSTGSEFSETSNCLKEIPAGGSCTIAISFTPSHGGGRNGIVDAAFLFDEGGTEVAYFKVQGHAL